MKKISIKVIVITSVLCLSSLYAQPKAGKISSIKSRAAQIWSNKDDKLLKPEFLRLATIDNGEISLNIIEQNEISGESFYYGSLGDDPNTSFRLSIKEDVADGVVVDRGHNNAYKIYSDQQFNVYVKNVTLDEVVCTEYEVEAAPLAVNAVPPPTSAVYKLQSNPASKSVAYLDFDGEVVSGTRWASGATINALVGNFTEANIQEIFNMIAEDLSGFNVNVTTDSAIYGAATRTSRMRCIFTPTNTASPGAGGVAYVGSFTYGDETPCWVFNGGVKSAGEAGSHELGHTLGLSHDGRTTPTEGYFAGHGSWGPIMGASYSRSIVHWSMGEYNAANQKQDDINIINTRNGFTYKVDDFGNTIAAAGNLVVETTGTVLAANNKGVIERRTDVDFLKFTSVGGSVTITASPAAAHPNLDIKLDLLDGAGTVLQTANPSGLSASITYNLAPGTYYISIDGVGAGDPATNGYSDYGSIGVFSISGTIPATPPANYLPNVLITAPVSGRIYDAPATINLTATAQDIDGTITKVEFFNGTTKLGEDLTAPYEYTWANVAIGNYTNVTAKATDNQAAVTTSSVISIIVKKPDCKVPNFKVIYDRVLGTDSSYTNNGRTKDLAFDDDSLTYFDSPSASGSWVGLELNKIYRITGVRYYPRASYGSRMNGGKFQGCNVPDFSTGVVDLATISSTPVVEWNCVTVTNTNSFKYVRYLSPNNSQCNVAEIQFYGIETPNQEPVVTITSPVNNTKVIVPQSITVTVAASDADGTITKVELYEGDEKLGEDATSPYEFTVQIDTAKKWLLIAKATDNVAEYDFSDTVLINARNVECKINGVVVKTYTILGTTGSYNSSGLTRDKAFDKDSSSYFDSPNSSNSWVGVDLGSNKNIVGVRVYPRIGYPNRMNNGRIQIATNATFSSGVVNIDTLTQVKNDEWNCVAFPTVRNNRYVRYLSPSQSYGNIAEFEVYLQNTAPSVSLTSLTTTFSSVPANITLNVSASDVDGSIKTLELFENNIKIADLVLNNGSVVYNKALNASGTYTYVVKATDDLGTVTSSSNLVVTVNSVTSLADVLSAGETYLLSPNPSQGSFEIQSVKDIDKVQILDLQGKIVVSINDSFSNIHLPESLNKGLYTVDVWFVDGSHKTSLLMYK